MVVSPLSLDLYYCCIRLLLYCCNTWWVVGGSLRGRHCCTTFCCTAVSRWVDRLVAVTLSCVPPAVCPPLRGLFFSCFFFLPLYRPRAGIVQRTTINSTTNSTQDPYLKLETCMSRPEFPPLANLHPSVLTYSS